jgi:tRNA (mo5U34)-methyltransferase
MDEQELRRRVDEIHWIHSLDLGHGITTPGLWPPLDLPLSGCPTDLRGMSVLDCCAADGGVAFQAERMGAASVLATDSFLWGGHPGTSKAGFDLAREALGSKVESRYLEVLDHSPETVGVHDVVLFLGVLYHMRHPLLALERVFSVTRNLLVLETHLDMLDYDRPAMAFYPGAELNGDASNWWGPNIAAVDAMLKDVGFHDVKVVLIKPYAELSRDLGVFKHGQQTLDWVGTKQARGIFNASR